MKIRTLIITAAIVVGGAATAGAGAAVASSYMHPASVDAPLVERNCIIRFDRWKPRIHVNAAHACVGFTEVTVESDGDLRLRGPGLGPITFIAVEEDETVVAKGFSCGGSGGDPVVIVRCYTRDGKRVHMGGGGIRHPYANLWIKTTHWAG